MFYNYQERTFLVKKFAELKNITLVQRAFRSKYKNKKAPDYTTIKKLVNKFDSTGSVLNNCPKTRKKRPKITEAIECLKQLYLEKPETSLRKSSNIANVSVSTTRTILINELKLKPYKTRTVHELLESDPERRISFAKWFLNLPDGTENFIVCTDEAYFELNLSINSQNNRKWLDSRRLDYIEKPLHPSKLLVWCGISSHKVYGPYFFEEPVNQTNYLEMIKNYFWPLHYRQQESRKYYFQQDGARPHTSITVQEFLFSKFNDKFIDKNMWPARSPDLNPCDFFLWGYLKEKVYNPLPSNLSELRENIEREIRKINKNVLKDTFSNFKKRLLLVIQKNGSHIE